MRSKLPKKKAISVQNPEVLSDKIGAEKVKIHRPQRWVSFQEKGREIKSEFFPFFRADFQPGPAVIGPSLGRGLKKANFVKLGNYPAGK